MKLNNVLFMAAFTTRSQSYAQAMKRSNLHPENVLLFGNVEGSLPGQLIDKIQKTKTHNSNSLFYPDFNEPLLQTCKYAKWNFEILSTNSIKDPIIQKQVEQIKPEMIIYSGYGSQIVPEKLINLGIPILHLHSGFIPDYKGSTTLYYSLLQDNECGVSAILLNSEIDSGPIIKRKKYPPPPQGIDLDHLYDAAIRADLLVEVLIKDYQNGNFNKVTHQSETAQSFYVIHPVLKHLAILKQKDKSLNIK
ncbi:Methionyl-tRNA formyltransferase-like protein [Desulfamplus magnetovallimortis]|uniref:Methionyl-tRNA formyltransferase-like protein n=1 Tax=Desulfamplus magnetovallimortis TaxID=1246637 RepID=A0A1W1HEI8_9BACT|nr:formyltransferase family protein [Desulfamplus magnetovallimortis]SLM30909.1 Methionyl-tRNA formyltransferase-like protein [Desulfamplus magnetovallimortis]